ncbi:MAG: hypothetical protein ABSG79_14695 [Bryobacteraceae bacterium]
MTKISAALAGLLLAVGWPAGAGPKGNPQASDEPVTVSSDHPRLFLRPARLRLLKRERERASARWQQFDAFLAGNAPLPEPGWALALYYQISGNAAAGRQAVAWALGPGADLRQLALVFDWCQDLLSEQQRRDLAARLQKGMAADAANDSIAAVRSRVLAAVALFDHVPEAPQRELEGVVRNWWNGKMAPAIKKGSSVVARDDAYPLFELLHAMRDSTTLDLRECCPRFFKDFPIEHLVSHYPAVYEAPENEYRIGPPLKPDQPDLRLAALSRAAELAMVAYDVNAAESQVLQGWLMHDQFMLRGTFGAPYEFLWANPYQPGLSYYLAPLVYHNPDSGRLFIRSSWEDDARWFAYFDGGAQMFADGHLTVVNPRSVAAPISLGEAVVCLGPCARKFRVKLEEEEAAFVVGLDPRRTYQVEIDDEEVLEAVTDAGGIIELDLPHGKEVGVRIREAPPLPAPGP